MCTHHARQILRLVTVCDAATGVVLFEEKWHWHEGANSEGAGRLVRSFFQIAREIDDGTISRVVFELPPQSAPAEPPAPASSPAIGSTKRFEFGGSGGGSVGGSGDTMVPSPPLRRGRPVERMEMLCTRSASVLVVLFHSTLPPESFDLEEQHVPMRELLEQVMTCVCCFYMSLQRGVGGGRSHQRMSRLSCSSR